MGCRSDRFVGGIKNAVISCSPQINLEVMSEPPISIDVNNVQFVERLLNEFLRDPVAVPPDWQEYFREHVGGNGDGWAGVPTAVSAAEYF